MIDIKQIEMRPENSHFHCLQIYTLIFQLFLDQLESKVPHWIFGDGILARLIEGSFNCA